MTIDKSLVDEYAQLEALQIMKQLLMKYPPEKQDSGAIIVTALENAIVLALTDLEKGMRAKDVLKVFSKNVLKKIKVLKENIELHQKEQNGKDKV